MVVSEDSPGHGTAERREAYEAFPEGIRVGDATRRAAGILADAGVDSPAQDARLLMSYALATAQDPPARAALVPPAPVSQSELFMADARSAPEVYAEWVERRAGREPLQHIVGAAGFYGLDFFSKPGAFIPRPETELLVEWAVEQIEQVCLDHTGSELARRLFTGQVTVVDVCCGPGTILLSVAHACSALFDQAESTENVAGSTSDTPDTGGALMRELCLVGVEISAEALDTARRNEAALRAQGLISPQVRIEFIQADVTTQSWIAAHELVAVADVVVSNPPYVPETALAEGKISPEVLADPYEAVFSGSDGLDSMAPLAVTMALLSAPRAEWAVEHDDANGVKVQEVLRGVGAVHITQHQDLTGRDRFVSAAMRRPPTYIPPRPEPSQSDAFGRSAETRLDGTPKILPHLSQGSAS